MKTKSIISKLTAKNIIIHADKLSSIRGGNKGLGQPNDPYERDADQTADAPLKG